MIEAPIIKDIENINLPKVRNYEHVGIDCYILKGNSHEIIKAQFVFPAGRKFEIKRAQARMTNALMKEGSNGLSAEDVALTIDKFGFSLKMYSDLDLAVISLICLKKYFAEGFKLIKEMIATPNFNQSEIEKYADVAAHQLEAQLEKNDIISFREFTKCIFGVDHIYGYNTLPEDFYGISNQNLRDFHNRHYQMSESMVFLSGAIDEDLLAEMRLDSEKKLIPYEYNPGPTLKPEHVLINGNRQNQAAIKTGRRLFSRHHPDYIDMYICNVILGGYFGSRLMKNIREEKGYSYNIYSSVETMTHDGYFVIASEVGQKHKESTIDEIWKELELLKKEGVGKDELKMVKNYMLGQLLHSLDGPFSTSDLMRSLYTNKLSIDFLKTLKHRIKTIESADIIEVARKYLIKEDFSTVIVS